jgi:hypothetical protein
VSTAASSLDARGGVAESAAAVERRPPTWWPLALYTLLSLLLIGLPVLRHFGSRAIASDDIDSSQFMWFLAWWPHALLHGLNPFETHAIFVPQGFNLTWSTAMPGPGLLLAPITEIFSPLVTYNVIQLASPALTAWTTYLLCRHLTGRLWPSLIGGYVFGFSPYMLVHLTGGPYLALVPLLPVFVLLVLRRVEGSIGTRAFVLAMAAGLTGQYLISAEVLATATLFGGFALVVAYLLFSERRAALVDMAKLLVIAYAITAVLIGPFLYFFFFGHHYPPGAVFFPADVASFVVPPPLVALSRQHPAFAGANTEPYLGVPLVLLILAYIWQERRHRTTWLLTISLLAGAVCAVGSPLFFRGHKTSIPGPWALLSKLPVLHYAIPIRLVVFAVLPAAVIVALWLSREPIRGRAGIWRWGLALLAVAFIVPDVRNPAWNTPMKDPPLFASGEYRSYLKPEDHVLTIPAWGPNERWQADTGFRFKLADGYAGNPFPTSYSRFPTWNTLLTGDLNPDSAAQLRDFVRAKGVTAIVVDPSVPGPWRTLFGTLGVRPVAAGGMLVYRLRPPSSGPA